MKHIGRSLPQLNSFILAIMFAGLGGMTLSCSKPPAQPKAPPSRPSDVKVEVRDGGPAVLTTSAAEFQILPSGFLQATLLKDGKRLTLDEPGVGSTGGSDSIVHEGKEFDFVPDFSQAKVLDSMGKLGRGKRVEIPGVHWRRREWRSSAGLSWKCMTIFRALPWSARLTKTSVPQILRLIRC